MRALVTFAFVLFLVMSAPLLLLAGAAFFLGGAFVFAIWPLLFLVFSCAFCVVWIKDERPKFLPSDIFYSHQTRNYKNWNSIHGWPREPRLFYECANCHNALPSQPDEPRECSCGNLFITPDHIGAQNPSRVLLFEEKSSVGVHTN